MSQPGLNPNPPEILLNYGFDEAGAGLFIDFRCQEGGKITEK